VIGRRQLRLRVGLLLRDLGEARVALRGVLFWARRVPGAAVCAATGRHRWGSWEAAPVHFLFSQPERRRCRRCGGSQGRGAWPSVRVVGGHESHVHFSWLKDSA
jgi:hypothetical protein